MRKLYTTFVFNTFTETHHYHHENITTIETALAAKTAHV
jgi:hypothetical protein